MDEEGGHCRCRRPHVVPRLRFVLFLRGQRTGDRGQGTQKRGVCVKGERGEMISSKRERNVCIYLYISIDVYGLDPLDW